MNTGPSTRSQTMAKTDKRPEPEAFKFRRQFPGETHEEYEDHEDKARARFNKLVGRSGRAQVVKGMLQKQRPGAELEDDGPASDERE